MRLPARFARRGVVVAVVVAVGLIPTAVWASHSFADVSDDNVFHEDIDWLADNGITRGCNPPENTMFCPADSVTRQQMAAFMRRLAESRAVDAGTLDGLDASAFVLKGEDGGDAPGDANTLDGFDSGDFAAAVGSSHDAQAKDSDLLDGQDSSDFLGAGDTAADSDLLDGKDSTAFLGSNVRIEVDSDPVASGQTREVDASCRVGRVLTGGGFFSTMEVFLLENGPDPDAPRSWDVEVKNVDSVDGTLTVYAVCAVPGG